MSTSDSPVLERLNHIGIFLVLGDDEESQAAADQLQATIQALAAGEMPSLDDATSGDGANQEMYGKMMEQFQNMGESPEMQAMMDRMMRHILSKDILYQPMEEVGEKYPQWLAENRSSLSDEDVQRYTKQQALIMELCKVLSMFLSSSPL